MNLFVDAVVSMVKRERGLQMALLRACERERASRQGMYFFTGTQAWPYFGPTRCLRVRLYLGLLALCLAPAACGNSAALQAEKPSGSDTPALSRSKRIIISDIADPGPAILNHTPATQLRLQQATCHSDRRGPTSSDFESH